MDKTVRKTYLWTRRHVRNFVKRVPALDLAVGRSLVRLDMMLRRTGLVSVTATDTSEFTFRGFRFNFDERNRDLAETILTSGEYEAETLEEIATRLQPGMTFVDLGANLGFFTVQAAAVVGPTGRVFAFEPTPATAALLRQNVDRNGLAPAVTVVEAAVSRQPGRARFAMFSSAQANSIAVAADAGAAEMVDVEVTSLDAYFAGLGWPAVDVVKMDVEGQELEVFAGMHELVTRNPSLRVIFEYHRGQLKRTGIDGRTLIDAARSAGFDTFAALFHHPQRLDLPAEMPALERLAARANVNILAWRA